MNGKLFSPVEIREVGGRKRLVGVVIAEGRAAAGGRAEVFTPGSVTWPVEGMRVRIGHGGPVEGRAHPARHPNGEIRISAPATAAMVSAVAEGRKGMSVEFVALAEGTTKGGVREIRRAYVDAVALVSNPEYQQATAEIRTRRKRRVFL